MTAKERCLAAGLKSVLLFAGETFDDAFLGVTEDNRAIYDFYKMVYWLMDTKGIDRDAALDWVCCNTMCDLASAGEKAPIIMYSL